MPTMTSTAMRKPKRLSELERARMLGLVGAVKGGPRNVAERHSRYLKLKLRRCEAYLLGGKVRCFRSARAAIAHLKRL